MARDGILTTYLIYKQEYSEKAMRMHGYPYTWHLVRKIRQRPPSSEVEFHKWLWNLVKEYGAGIYRIVRTQNKGERKGFHGVWLGYIDRDYINIDRRYSQYKGIPSVPPSRDLWFKRPKERVRFRKRGKRRF